MHKYTQTCINIHNDCYMKNRGKGLAIKSGTK